MPILQGSEEEVGTRGGLGAEPQGQTLGAELLAVDQRHAHEVETSRLESRDGDGGLVDGHGADEEAVEVEGVLERGLGVFGRGGEGPVEDGAVGFDGGEVGERGGGDVEAEEGGELGQGLVEDAGGAVDEPGNQYISLALGRVVWGGGGGGVGGKLDVPE